MPHNLLRDRMAFVCEPPWHGLGKCVPSSVPASEMIIAAGLDWRVWMQPAPGARYDETTGGYERYLTMRNAIDGEADDVMLGVVGPGYVPLQNVDAFRFFEPFVGKGKWARFETAGALGHGERVWVQAKLRGTMCVGRDDEINRFLLLSNAHDGSGAVTVRFTGVRVVCQNTLNLALVDGTKTVAIWHTRRLHARLHREQVTKLNELKQMSESVFAEARDLFEKMAEYRMDGLKRRGYLERLHPRTPHQIQNRMEPLRWLRVWKVLEDDNVTPPRTRDTLWGLYNAVVREEDFRATREKNADARLNRVWFGRGSDLKLKALVEARALVARPRLN